MARRAINANLRASGVLVGFFVTIRSAGSQQERGLTPLKVRAGRKIVVELEPELPFEIVRGSQGGAQAKIAGVLRALSLCRPPIV